MSRAPRGAPAALVSLALLAGCVPEPPPAGGAAPAARGAAADEFQADRLRMVASLREAKVRDERVLAAMERIPRHEFVPRALRSRSYINTPLPIEESQTISAPDIVAIMTEVLALKGTERVLEIGTGSGYQAAVLGELVPEVYTVEIRPALARSARETLETLRAKGVLGYKKVEVIVGDGFRGHPPAAPYDAIIVTAAPRQVPTELINQLKPGGRMVIPVGEYYQELQLIEKREDGSPPLTQKILPVRFVPMIGGDQ